MNSSKKLCLIVIATLILYRYITNHSGGEYMATSYKSHTGIHNCDHKPEQTEDTSKFQKKTSYLFSHQNTNVMTESFQSMAASHSHGGALPSYQQTQASSQWLDTNAKKVALDLARKIIHQEIVGLQAYNKKQKVNGTSTTVAQIKANAKKQIVIVTYWRSGSTFLGEILNQSPGTYYHFEPLYMYGSTEIVDTKEEETRALKLVTKLLHCNYTHLDSYYLRFGHDSQHQFLLRHNVRLWNICRTDVSLCKDPEFLTSLCQEYPTQLVKLTRLRLNSAILLLMRNPDVKVVYLVRDPRGIFNSRKTLEWCTTRRSCGDTLELCSQMQQDLSFVKSLRRQFRGRFIVLRYEDLSLQVVEKTRELFKFFGLKHNKQVETFLQSHTSLQNATNPYTLMRNSKKVPFLWRQKLKFDEIKNIQEQCHDVMVTLHYPLIKRSEELKEEIDYVKWLYKSS